MSKVLHNETEVYISRENDPQFNLALEEVLFNEIRSDQRRFLFYVNRPSVIIGKHQNPWTECALDKMAENGIGFFRRFSGGGTVYHDLGNLNLSFMGPVNHNVTDSNVKLALKHIRSIGVEAYQKDKSDLFMGDKKFSGSAFAIKKDKILHHMTFLVSTDLAHLKNWLKPMIEVAKSNGLVSRRAEVMNLSEVKPDLNVAGMREGLISLLKKDFPMLTVREVGVGDISPSTVDAGQKKMKSWDWRYGNTPDFEIRHRLSNKSDSPDFYISIHRGKIKTIRVDNNDNHQLKRLQNELLGLRFNPLTLSSKIEDILNNLPKAFVSPDWEAQAKLFN